MKISRLLHILVIALALLVAVPAPAAKRRTKSRAKTTATTKSKSKRKSSKRSSLSRRKSSGSTTNWSAKAAREDATQLPVETSAPTASTRRDRVSDSKRKIKVEKPDLEEIRRITLDPQSKFYFPKLRRRYEVNDTTMTAEEFRNFYLGYMFQEDYDPYRESPYPAMTDSLRMKPSHTKEEIDTILKYTQLALQDNPFDLRQMSFLVHVLKEKRKDMRAKIWEYRLEHLLGAIKSTGTGDSVDNAWYVMTPSHEYDIVQLLGYEAVDAQYIEPGYDYLVVRPDETDPRKRDKSAQGFYFNVMVPQQQYELKHPGEE